MGLHVEVIGNQLTGYVTKGSNTHNFSATLTNMDAGYFAQGFGDKAPNIFPMTIQVGGMNVGKAEEVAGGKLTADTIPAALASGDRTKAGATAPAKGLFLEKVFYGEETADGKT